MAAAEEVIMVDELLAERRVARRESGRGNSGCCLPSCFITDDSDMQSVVTIQEDEWLRSITNDKDDSGNKQSQKPKIQKVPRMLRKIKSNTKCYDPLVVSIGPYHHGKPELEPMEKLKVTMARDYARESGKPIADLYKKVVQLADDARNCYAEGSTEGFDDEAFIRMMFLDGCFILQFIYCVFNDKRKPMKMKSHDLPFVKRDLFLLENQLPFRVLKELMSLRRFENDDGIAMINKYIQLTQGQLPQPNNRGCEDQPVHLLELFRTQLINRRDPSISSELKRYVSHFKPGKTGCFTKNVFDPSNGWSSYRSAKELRTFGIHFRPGKTSCFTEVKYKSTLLSGLLTLPPITVDDFTKSMLLNLVAYETCPDAPDDYGVTSYICFLDSLIDHAEDVQELRSKGILLNFLGSDQQVADLFNEIANDLVPNPCAYADVKAQIERHYNNKIKIWIAEWLHAHFSSPWTVLTFIGAILAIALSLAQTYYARFPPKNS